MLSIEDVRAAARRLAPVAHRTPVLTSRTLDEALGAETFLKAENLQRVGAFKFRGAYNRLSTLEPEVLAAGVTTVSSGNHAQAVALSARLLSSPATILMPADAPVTKLEATRGYGAEVVLYDRYGEDRMERVRALAEERGLTIVHPYDDEYVMAGQGTVALELFEQVSDVAVLVAPIGGGGLISGCSTVAKHLGDVRVIGVEPEEGDDTKRSLEAGRRIKIDVPRTIADGQQVETPGELTFEVMSARVDEVVTVTDAEIVGAMAFLFERMKLVVEPSGACAAAALLAGKIDVGGRRTGVIVSGGNVGIDRFHELLNV